MSEGTIEFSLSTKYKTFICKLCAEEYLVFSINRSVEFDEEDIFAGPLIRQIYCPCCGEEN